MSKTFELPADADVEKASNESSSTNEHNGKPYAIEDTREKNKDSDDRKDEEKMQNPIVVILMVISVVALLYAFICSLDLLASAFRLLGGRTAGKVFATNEAINNPVAGLMIGVLVTVLLQSSSTTTSIIITMVGAGLVGVKPAINMIMGANIGTSVTNTIVAISSVQDRKVFQRAFSGAVVHDCFNILTVCILLPIEVTTGFLRHTTKALEDWWNIKPQNTANIEILSRITKPLVSLIIKIDKNVIKSIAKGETLGDDDTILSKKCENDPSCSEPLFNRPDWSDTAAGAVVLVIALTILCICIVLIVKSLNVIFRGAIRRILRKSVNGDLPGKIGAYLTGYIAIVIGAVLTICVQSSSIFTSALTPLIGAEVITLERALPLTLGANIGTCVTGLLAALAVEGENFTLSLQISLCHLFFNIVGILIWYPIPFIRQFPIHCAKRLGKSVYRYRWFAFAYLFIVFFITPASAFGLSFAGDIVFGVVVGILFLFIIIICIMKAIMYWRPSILPKKLQNWKFLPVWFRSLAPYDRIITGWFYYLKGKTGISKNNSSSTKTLKTNESDFDNNDQTEYSPDSKPQLQAYTEYSHSF